MKNLLRVLFVLCVAAPAFSQKGAYDFQKKWKALLAAQAESAQRQATVACLKDSSIQNRWDAGTNAWDPVTRYIYGYDGSGNLDKQTISTKNGNNWIPFVITSATFDASRNRVSELSISWNASLNAYENSYQGFLTYDANNNRLSSVNQSWNSSANTWKNEERYSYTYAQNNLSAETFELWDVPSGTWKIQFSSTYTYTGNNATTEIGKTWDPASNSLQNDYRFSYTYDASNNLVNFQGDVWNSVNSAWVNDMKATLTNSGANLLQVVTLQWNTATSSWVNDTKNLYTYDANNNTVSEINTTWLGSTNTWQTSYSTVMTYDAANNQLSYTSQTLNSAGTALVNDSRAFYTYDANNNKLLTVFEPWDLPTSTWVKNFSDQNYYNCLTVGLKKFSEDPKKIIIYPSPAKADLTIEAELEYSTAYILNMNGQIILSSSEKTNRLDISTLKAGIYFIQFIDKNNHLLQTEKFIKD